MRHLLQRLVRVSVIQSRAAQYTLQSSTCSSAPPHTTSSSPVLHHSRVAQPALGTQQASRGQWTHSLVAGLQPHLNTVYTQNYGIPHHVSGGHSGAPGTHRQQQQGHMLESAPQLVSDLQLGVTAPHHVQQQDAASFAADVQQADGLQAWGQGEVQPLAVQLPAVQPPAMQHQSLRQQALQHHAMQMPLGMGQPQGEATVVMAYMSAEDHGVHHNAQQGQSSSVMHDQASSAGPLGGIDSYQGSVPEDQQSHADMIRMLVHQQHALAVSLQQMRREMHALRTAVLSEFQALTTTHVGKVRLKPLN